MASICVRRLDSHVIKHYPFRLRFSSQTAVLIAAGGKENWNCTIPGEEPVTAYNDRHNHGWTLSKTCSCVSLRLFWEGNAAWSLISHPHFLARAREDSNAPRKFAHAFCGEIVLRRQLSNQVFGIESMNLQGLLRHPSAVSYGVHTRNGFRSYWCTFLIRPSAWRISHIENWHPEIGFLSSWYSIWLICINCDLWRIFLEHTLEPDVNHR